jgi:hypothetical protein
LPRASAAIRANRRDRGRNAMIQGKALHFRNIFEKKLTTRASSVDENI